jgi:hypothetical protein
MKTKKIVIKNELEKTIEEIRSKQDTVDEKELDGLYSNVDAYEKIIEDYGENAEVVIRRLSFKEQCKIYDLTANMKIRGNVTIGEPKVESNMIKTVEYGLVSINGEKPSMDTLPGYFGEWIYNEIQDFSSITPKKKRY